MKDVSEVLEESKNQVLGYFDLSKEQLCLSYGPGKWNIRQILVHLADAEGVLLERIKRTIAEDNPPVEVFDPDLWQENLNYDHIPLSIVKAQFLANRDLLIYFATQFYTSKGHRTNMHSAVGLRTLKQDYDKVVLHCESHIGQIKNSLGLV
jgi:hypothetical protein